MFGPGKQLGAGNLPWLCLKILPTKPITYGSPKENEPGLYTFPWVLALSHLIEAMGDGHLYPNEREKNGV